MDTLSLCIDSLSSAYCLKVFLTLIVPNMTRLKHVKGRPDWLVDSALEHMDVPSPSLFSCSHFKLNYSNFCMVQFVVIILMVAEQCTLYTAYCKHIEIGTWDSLTSLYFKHLQLESKNNILAQEQNILFARLIYFYLFP